jgi:HD-GYP domain-containing protein (c-di-GMP phosphodiesterase class II)
VEIVLGHHEKLDGSGYPRGLTAPDLSAPVRACCIADIFDALTTNRAYKRAFPSFRALQLMRRQMSGKLDQQLVGELIKLVGESSAQSSESRAA